MNETFVFGKDKVPAWFNDQANLGRIKIFYDDDMKVVRAKIMSGVNEYMAEIGDSIMNTKSGIIVIKEDKAKKYKVQDQKKEDKKEEANDGLEG